MDLPHCILTCELVNFRVVSTFLAIKKNATMNTHVQVFVCYFPWEYTLERNFWQLELHGNPVFNLLRKYQTAFQTSHTTLHVIFTGSK
jgi:hypothetical protein